jgi:hypothetical protein
VRARALLLPLALLLGLALPLAAAAQVVMEEVGALQEAYNTAQQAYQSVQFRQAVDSLNPLVDSLTKWEQAGRLQPPDEALLEKALELRGTCAFNLGKTDLARQDWTRLIQLRPDYPFSVAKTPKILKLFEEIRSSLTGTIVLSVDPADANVTLDGRALRLTSGTVPVLRGLHVLRASRPGYAAQEREISIEVGTSAEASIKLVPNARSIYFFARPEGAQLLVDGKPVGRADRPASAQDDWARFARESGADPSQVYVIPALHLPPGEHRVALVAPCHRKREFALTVVLDTVANSPGFVKPIVLERRTVNLEVVSHPSGSQVVIDGQAVGTTPVNLADFCIGSHEILVQKQGVGLYRSSVNVTEGTVFRVDATLRPTLLWAGLTRDQDVTPRQQEAATESLAAALPAMKQFNAVLAVENNPVLPDTFFTPGVGAQDQAAAVRELCEKYRCQGLLAGRLTVEGGKPHLTLRLFVPEFGGYDESETGLKEASEAPAALSLVDRPLVESSAASALPLADVPGGRGPAFILGVADPAGPTPGDILLSVGAAAQSSAAAARSALAGAENPVLKFMHRGEEKTWTFKSGPGPQLVPYGGESFGNRRLWLKARQGVLGSETPQEQLIARLCLCLAELNLGRPVEALKALDPLQPPAAGPLNSGTVGYLRAVALVQLGRVEEARPMLAAAAADNTATLDGLGEVLVQPLAADLLRQLPPPPPSVPPATAR